MEQQTPIPPQIKDEAARSAKTRHFPILDLGGGGGGGDLGFPFILSKIKIYSSLGGQSLKWKEKVELKAPYCCLRSILY